MYHNNYSVRVLTRGQPVKETNQYVFLKDKQAFELSLRNDNSHDSAAHVSIDGALVGIYKVKANKKVIIDCGMNDNGKFIFLKRGTEEFNEVDLPKVDNDDLGVIEVIFHQIQPEWNIDFTEWFKGYKETVIIKEKCCGCNGCCDCNHGWKKTNPWNPLYPTWTTISTPLSINMSGDTKAMTVYNESKADNNIGNSVLMCSVSPGGVGLSGVSNKEYDHVNEDKDKYSSVKPTRIFLRLVCKEGEDDVKKIRSKTFYSTAKPVPV